MADGNGPVLITEGYEDETLSFQFEGEGVLNPATQKRHFKEICIVVDGVHKNFKVGDTVTVLAGSEYEPNWPCRIEDIWTADQGDATMKTRWFFNANEVRGLPSTFVGAISKDSLADRMHANELVLSAEADENHCSSILENISVKFTDDIPAGSPVPFEFYCRYILVKSPGDKTVTTVSHFSESPERQLHTLDETVLAIEADASMTSESSADDSSRMGQQAAQVEGEGSMLRGSIQVGKSYQVDVPPFEPGATVRSRNAVLVWKKDAMDDAKLHLFLSKVALLHNEFLDRAGMSMNEPHSPLPTGPTEHWMRAQRGRPLTGSFMSTASMMASPGNEGKLPKLKNTLRKECDPDVLMELLSNHDYNIDSALATISKRLEDLSPNVWSCAEHDQYDAGFRRHQTDLRHVAKGIPTRSVKETIDYHFRYKIPDQFRKFQDAKREQAVRMVECMEKRRYHDAIQGNAPAETSKRRRGVNPDSNHWSETVVTEVPQALEARRRQAREFLREVNDAVGPKIMAEMAEMLRALHSDRTAEKRDALFALLGGNSRLRSRLLEFFPKEACRS